MTLLVVGLSVVGDLFSQFGVSLFSSRSFPAARAVHIEDDAYVEFRTAARVPTRSMRTTRGVRRTSWLLSSRC